MKQILLSSNAKSFHCSLPLSATVNLSHPWRETYIQFFCLPFVSTSSNSALVNHSLHIPLSSIYSFPFIFNLLAPCQKSFSLFHFRWKSTEVRLPKHILIQDNDNKIFTISSTVSRNEACGQMDVHIATKLCFCSLLQNLAWSSLQSAVFVYLTKSNGVLNKYIPLCRSCINEIVWLLNNHWTTLFPADWIIYYMITPLVT
jgi:hypothetical protein